MLLRRLGETIAISQPHHAWVSGELARAWGNERFAVPQPREAVICGTALHDIGWLDWERAPRLAPETGLPLTFPGVRAQEHAPMWRRGVEWAQAYGALPALIVARHGESMYQRFFDPGKAPQDAVAAVREFLDWQRAFCASIVARLSREPSTAGWVGADNLAFVKAFVAALDAVSLHLCWGVANAVAIADVPQSPAAATTLTLSPRDDGAVVVDPWPFGGDAVQVAIEGRRLDRTYRDQNDLDAALHEAPTVVIETELRAA